MTKKHRYFLLSLLIASITAYFYFSKDNEEDVDTRYNGAFRLADGSIATIVPSNSTLVRLRHADDGQVQSMSLQGDGTFQLFEGFSSRDPVATGQFSFSPDGIPVSAHWSNEQDSDSIQRIPLKSEEFYFDSGDLRLRGKLTLPQGQGPFPVAIMMHGSEDYSAVDFYHLPYMLAAHGIAGFKFDKRGTGQSEGEYTQHFPTLAGDVVAAIDHLKQQYDIDPNRINLVGFSQAGWIEPLVAKQTIIKSYVVAYGCAVSVKREDRWGYVKRLMDKGFGEKEIALADQMNKELDILIEKDNDQAWDRLFALRDQHIDDDWFAAIAGSDSILGVVAEKATSAGSFMVPDFGWKMYFDWRRGDGPNFNRSYEPRETLEALSTPSLWLMAGEDTSIPTKETTDVLDQMRALGKAIEYKVYDGAEHGNILYKTDAEGNRTYTGYAPSYFSDIVTWIKQQNNLQ